MSDIVRVAQAVSATIEAGVRDSTNETFLPDAVIDEDCEEFIDGVGAELIHLASAEAFEIRLANGRVFQIMVTEVTGRQQTTIL
jgi:hypothetical protein